MLNFIRHPRKLKANSFTLVELLVVISIIGVLAGLATPAMTKALDKGKQTTDVSNGRQLYTILFSAANDDVEGGYFFFGTAATNAGSSTAAFNSWITNGGFPYSRKVLAGTKVAVDKSVGSNSIQSTNLFWGCTVGVTTSDDATVPLLYSYGEHCTRMNSTGNITLGTDGPWGNKGVVIVNVGGGASFVAPGTGGADSKSIRSGLLSPWPSNAVPLNR